MIVRAVDSRVELQLLVLLLAPALMTLVDEDCRGPGEYKRESTSQASPLLTPDTYSVSSTISSQSVYLAFRARSDISYGSKEDSYLSAFQIAQARTPLDPQIQIRVPSPHHPQPAPFLARSTSSDCLKSSSLPHSSHTTSNLLPLFARYILLPRRTDILHHVCHS